MNERMQHSRQEPVEHLGLLLDVLDAVYPVRARSEYIFLQRHWNPIRQNRLGEELEVATIEPSTTELAQSRLLEPHETHFSSSKCCIQFASVISSGESKLGLWYTKFTW